MEADFSRFSYLCWWNTLSGLYAHITSHILTWWTTMPTKGNCTKTRGIPCYVSLSPHVHPVGLKIQLLRLIQWICYLIVVVGASRLTSFFPTLESDVDCCPGNKWVNPIWPSILNRSKSMKVSVLLWLLLRVVRGLRWSLLFGNETSKLELSTC